MRNPSTQQVAARARRRLRRRAKQRGAAMIEAAIVIPTMCLFLGLIVYSGQSYDKKIDQQQATRAAALYYASNGCEETEGGPELEQGKEGGGAADTGGGDQGDPTQSAAGNLRGSEKNGVDRSWNMAKAHASTTVGGKAFDKDRSYTFSRQVASTSEVACNEKRYDNFWTQIFSFIGDFVSRGGGFF